MKRLLLLALALCLALSFALTSCTPEDAYDSDTQAPDTSDSDAPDTVDPLVEKTEQIKADVLAHMADDDREDPMRLFDYFLGDYTIGSITSTDDYGAAVESVWQKDGVCVIEYRDGHRDYSLVRNGYVFKLTEQGGNTAVVSVTSYDAADSHIPSIFDDFGVGINAIYSPDDGEDTPEPVLTEDMLTVSDDFAECKFSEAYMEEVTDMLLDAMGLDAAQKAEFKASGSSTGIYTVADNTVTFTITGKHPQLGDMTMTVKHADKGEDGYEFSQKMEYTISAEGVTIPTSNEMIMRSVKYDGDKVVSADFESRVFEVGAEIIQNGVSIVMDTSNITRIYLDKNTNSLDLMCDQQAKTTVLGQSQSSDVSVRLSVMKNNFSYSSAQNGLSISQIQGANTVFSAPDGKEIPQIVFELADKEYYNIIG